MRLMWLLGAWHQSRERHALPRDPFLDEPASMCVVNKHNMPCFAFIRGTEWSAGNTAIHQEGGLPIKGQ